ncbi:MAG: S1 RNA-binding domain-containing protein, partial [Rhodospirillales bacterium]|nr:S1 RNA-binding domain-containing protein [Rhodospirillales bacterium]
MTTRMLIDGTHPEETRVVVATGKRLEEYDIETSTKTQLKGNIYLAKVTRVEPSLQAAFVDFGGNRHGFLAFNEIHPDYYQIPLEDREALLADQAELAKNAEAAQAHLDEIDGDVSATDETPEDETNGEEADNEEGADEKADAATDAAEGEDGAEDEPKPSGRRKARRRPQHRYAIQEVIKRR